MASAIAYLGAHRRAIWNLVIALERRLRVDPCFVCIAVMSRPPVDVAVVAKLLSRD